VTGQLNEGGGGCISPAAADDDEFFEGLETSVAASTWHYRGTSATEQPHPENLGKRFSAAAGAHDRTSCSVTLELGVLSRAWNSPKISFLALLISVYRYCSLHSRNFTAQCSCNTRASSGLAALADQGIEHSASPYDSQATRGIPLTMALELPRQLPAVRGHGMRRPRRRQKNTQRLARKIESSTLLLPRFRHGRMVERYHTPPKLKRPLSRPRAVWDPGQLSFETPQGGALVTSPQNLLLECQTSALIDR
jgi:hypothetical protein